jgi:antitoxin VapB
MSRVEEIERAIRDLGADEFAQLAQYVYALEQDRWDARMDRDASGGLRILAGSAILPFRGRILVSLNIKNPRAYQLASQLAELTGESLTGVVIESLEARLREERRKQARTTIAARMLAFADRFAAGMSREHGSADHATLLYGDDGLPQ